MKHALENFSERQVCQLQSVSTEGFTPQLCAVCVPDLRSWGERWLGKETRSLWLLKSEAYNASARTHRKNSPEFQVTPLTKEQRQTGLSCALSFFERRPRNSGA
jgi:hypothetical protein